MTTRIGLTDDLATCLALRREVFIGEQQVPEADEIDGLDGEARHLLAEVDGMAMGTARLLRVGRTGKIGRVCVRRSARGTGLGAALMLAAIARFRADGDIDRVTLGAQTHAVGFYEQLGFEAHGPDYLDAGIMHRDMTLLLGAD